MESRRTDEGISQCPASESQQPNEVRTGSPVLSWLASAQHQPLVALHTWIKSQIASLTSVLAFWMQTCQSC